MRAKPVPRRRTASLVAAAVMVSYSAAGAGAEIDGKPRDQATTLADAAVAANPSIKAIEARIAALGERVVQTTAWLDPKLSLDYSNMPIDAWRPGEHSMSGIQLNLQQTFFFPGKIGRRKAVAEGQVRQTRAELAEREVALRALVERAYYDLALVRQLREVTDAHVKLVEQFTNVVRYKYEVGKAGLHDLIRLQVLGKKLRDDLETFDRDDRALTAEINATLHRPRRTAIQTPPRAPVVAAPAETTPLETWAEESRPLLQMLDEKAQTRRLAADRAAREGYPDITASVGYRFRAQSDNDAGTDFIGVGLSAPLPFWYDRRWGSERREQEALARAAEQQREAELDQIRGELGRVRAAWKRAADQAKVYRETLMPLAHRALDATFAAYQVDRADFASLFQAELQLLDFEKTIRRAEAATHVQRVHAEALVGRSLR